ncbi:hypothetical protein V5O48_006572 [Marasmius crinis-equi]|uniref:Uncharacterized protein n=1 Tax=Marasmius crinis-equi TaxID=585013 RepID=A0ABR3FJQ2_9AGAR
MDAQSPNQAHTRDDGYISRPASPISGGLSGPNLLGTPSFDPGAVLAQLPPATLERVLSVLRNGPPQVDPAALQQIVLSATIAPEPQIDPVLATPDASAVAGSINPAPQALPTSLDIPLTPLGPRSSSPTPSTASSPTSTPSKKRIRPTKTFHPYGCVNGVMKGKVPYSVFRTSRLLGRIANRDKSTRHFNEGINRVLNKVERIADATGAWIFVTAQLPTASGGFINWTSPAMNREVPKPHMDKMKTGVLRVYDALVKGRRQDCVGLQLQATEAQAQRDAAQAELQREKERTARAKAILESQGIDIDSLLGTVES